MASPRGIRVPVAYGLVALGAFCISFAAPLVKWIEMGPTQIGFFRTAIASVTLAILGAMVELPGLRARGRDAVSGRSLMWAALAGACFGGDLFVWHKSILVVGVGLSTLLANTHIFWVACFSALLLGERLTLRFGLFVVVALFGVGLLSIPSTSDPSLYLTGIGLGLMTGLFYAGYYLCLRESQRGERVLPPALNLAIASAVTALVLLALVFITGEGLTWPSGNDRWRLLALGIGVHACGWVMISRGIPHVAAGPGSFILLLQTVLATVWGILWLDESFGGRHIVGGVITLGAIFGATTSRRV